MLLSSCYSSTIVLCNSQLLYNRNFHYVQALLHSNAVVQLLLQCQKCCCWLHSTACSWSSSFSWILLTLCCSVPWCIWWAFLLPCSLETQSSTILLSICAGSLDGHLKAFISWCLAVLLLCNPIHSISEYFLHWPYFFQHVKRVWRVGHLFVSHEDQSVHLRNPHLQT